MITIISSTAATSARWWWMVIDMKPRWPPVSANRATTTAIIGPPMCPYTRSTTQNLEKNALSSGVWHVRDRTVSNRASASNTSPKAAACPTPIMISAAATPPCSPLRGSAENIETLLRPENGYYLDGKIGSTWALCFHPPKWRGQPAAPAVTFTPKQKNRHLYRARPIGLCVCQRR